jgi:flagellar basal body-associated protein FliL
MKYTLSDKLIAYLTLISGLTISAVAIYYSVAGLVSIFAAAAIPIIVMGAVLEISKLIATVWLKINWSRAPTFIRTYLLIAIAILMLITSMGIFGFLSKAHSDAGLVSGDVQAKIAVYDEKIKTERENIDAARKALSQMDAQVNERLSRSSDDKGAERAVQIRRQQQAERTRLQNDISRSQGAIAKLNEERAPIAAEVRKVEAEVGPIKYIANFIYGDNPDTNVLEKAVTWVIIIIVIVFDPLAVILLLASQYSFQWFRQAREEETTEGDSPTSSESKDTPTVTTDELQHKQDPSELTADQLRQINDMLAQAVVHPEPEVPAVEESKIDKVDEQEIDQFLAEVDADDDDNHLNEPDHVKAAKAAWKLDYPNDSLKHQRRLLEQGLIKVLPWDLPPYTLTAVEDEAAVEAAKWAQEQIENSKKKVTTWMEKDGPTQIKKSVEE